MNKKITSLIVFASFAIASSAFAYKCGHEPGFNEGNSKFICSHELCGQSPAQMKCDDTKDIKKTDERKPSSVAPSKEDQEQLKKIQMRYDYFRLRW